MKKIIFLFTIALFCISSAVYSQSNLPLKNSFSLGGGPMWSINNSEGDFQDVAGNPTSAMVGMEYRHYFKRVIGLGVMYKHLTGNKDSNTLRCHYVGPTLTFRGLWANNKQGFWGSIGLGYFHYKEDLYNQAPYSKSHYGVSGSLGYEFAMSKGVGLQLRADLIMADFNPSGGTFHPVGGNYYYYDEYWDSALNYFSIGISLVFGK